MASIEHVTRTPFPAAVLGIRITEMFLPYLPDNASHESIHSSMGLIFMTFLKMSSLKADPADFTKSMTLTRADIEKITNG